MSNPQSIINICSGVNLTPAYKHTIYFDNASAQQNYFAGKVVKTFPAYSFLRKSWNIKVEANMEQAKTWTYLYFVNGSGKVYYYFITNIEYINDNTVELLLELDVMQTYMFDYNLRSCFVEREHAADDTIGANTVDEGLDVGTLTTLIDYSVDLGDLCILVLAAFDPMTTTEEHTSRVFGANYNGVFYGLGVYAVNMKYWQTWAVKLDMINAKLDGIVSMWMYPKRLVTLEDGHDWEDGVACMPVKSVASFNETVSRNTSLHNEYYPRNKKLYCYPYNFLYVSNNQGGCATYQYEKFTGSGSPTFKVCGALSPEAGVMIYPLYYNGRTLNPEEGLTLANYPNCAWNQDAYKLWLAQNQSSQTATLIGAGASIVAGTVTAFASAGVGALAGGGMVAGGIATIGNLMAQRKDASVQPPQARGNHSASVNVVNGFQTLTFEKKCITEEIAMMLDNYFDTFGYKVHTVKLPNRKVRQNWTYTKTVDCVVTGNICTEDKQKIESIYDNGITFWVNGDNIGNYDLPNNTL